MQDSLMTAILLSLVPLFAFGVSNGMQKLYVERLGVTKLIVYRGLTIVVLLSIYLFLNWETAVFDVNYMLIGAGIAFVSYFGLYFMNKGLEVGKVGLVIPVSSSRVLITAAVGAIFLSERLNIWQLALIGVVFVGVFLTSLNLKDIRNSQLFSWKSGIPFALLTAFFWGITFPFFGLPTIILGAALFSLILEATVTLTSIVQAFAQKEGIKLTALQLRENWRGVLVIGILGAIASVFMNMAYSTGHASIVTAVSSASPVVSIIYGRIFYKEILSTQQYLAIFLIIIGIVLLPIA